MQLAPKKLIKSSVYKVGGLLARFQGPSVSAEDFAKNTQAHYGFSAHGLFFTSDAASIECATREEISVYLTRPA